MALTPITYTIIQENDGYTKLIPKTSLSSLDPNHLWRDIIEHISQCREFKEIRTFDDPRRYERIIRCDCGEVWRINQLDLKWISIEDAKQLEWVFEMIEKGYLNRDNQSLMNFAYGNKIKKLRQKIVRKMQEVKRMQKSLTDIDELNRSKKLKHPIFCLELGGDE